MRGFDDVSLEHAHLMWPNGSFLCFCLRVDIDTVRDAKACSSLLPLLKENNVRATFFVATGPDDLGRNAFQAIKRAGRKKYAMRYGFDGLRGLLLPRLDVEEQLQAWREIIDQGHEIALHGYWHRRWAREALGWTEAETREAVKEGVRRFVRSFSFMPRGFAAPSFKTNKNLGRILGEIGFIYSSNTRVEGHLDFLKGARSSVLEIPVTCRNVEELLLDGFSEEQASEKVCRKLDEVKMEKGLLCYYIHPYFELCQCSRAFRRIMLRARELGAWTPTMGEVADWLRNGGGAEDTPDL